MPRLGRLVLRCGLAAGTLGAAALPAGAQQGSVQISTAVQSVQGNPERLAGQSGFDPDMAIAWLQPGTRFGVFQMEIRGTRRGDAFHSGRLYGVLRDLKAGGAAWTIEAGDAYFSPGIGDYRFANLFAPAVTFNGAAVTGRTTRSSIAVVAGRTTAWRNIFGSDPHGLGQTLGVVRATHHLTSALDVSARASRVRTSSLGEFSYTVDASDQVGGGARLAVTPALQIVADGSVVSYRRVGSPVRERDGSYLGGLSWLHAKGWVQINASRFSPGDFPALNNPMQDRQGLFAAGDYDLTSRVRLSAGWDNFRSNLRPAASGASARPSPQSSGQREFGGIRMQVSSRTAVTLRGELGGRRSRPIGPGFFSDSDTGSWAAEWQGAVRRTNTFVRYSTRRNVEHANDNGSYDQRDLSAQLFASMSQGSQLFGTALLSRTGTGGGSGNTYWQGGGGAQVRVPHHDLWLRAEGNAARNMDLLTRTQVPRESVGFGLNGQLSRQTTLAFNVNMDRAVSPAFDGTPWTTRSTLRVIRTMSTGSVRLAGGGATTDRTTARSSGSGTISGTVFADWNANGLLDAGENLLEGIPLRVGAGRSNTGRDGQFAFLNVPTGTREVGLDTGALPIDFDAPAVAQVQVDLARGSVTRVNFGLVPLGTIAGRVTRDANGNGRADPDEDAIDGAIVVLDGGARSEQARRGRYRFDSVRSGPHLVRLLVESLPDGSQITGSAELPADLSRGALTADVSFVVSIEKRPEIRKVFPSRTGAAAPAAPVRTGTRTTASRANAAPGAARTAAAPPRPAARRPDPGAPGAAAAPPPEAAGDTFAIQVAALSDPLRAKDIVQGLQAAGVPAYLEGPPPADPDAPYRVRVGPYATRGAAQRMAAVLEQERGEKLWVTKARPATAR